MPLGYECEFPDFNSCVAKHLGMGHTQAEAEKMCGQLQADTEGMCAARAMDMETCMAAKMKAGMSESEAHDACMAEMKPMMKSRQSNAFERRFMSAEQCPVQVEERDGEGPVITGYASVFHVPDDPATEYQLFPDLKERIMPRAFNKALQEKHNAAALFNHDPNYVLGRVASGTVRLSKDQRGLRYEIKPPATRADVVESIRRGDVTGSSFGFRVLDQKFRTENGIDIREIHSVELLDVSPTVYPAYRGTTTAVRSADDIDEVRAAHAAWKQEQAREAALKDKLAKIKQRADEIAALP